MGGLVLAGILAAAAVPAVHGQDLMSVPIGFRSGLTEGAVTTRPGTVTVDAGASVRWAGGATIYRAGELNVRVPLNRRIEGRLYTNSYVWRRTSGEVATGREDLSLAVAAMLLTHHALRPVTTLILRVETPTGSLPGLDRSWRPSARWVFGWELPGRIALHSNVGLARETSAGVGFTREFASVWVWRKVTGPIGMYGEVFGSTRERALGPSTRYVHGGVTYLLRPGAHLDVHGGLGSRSAGSPRWLGIGLRQRY